MEIVYCTMRTSIFGTIYLAADHHSLLDISLTSNDWEVFESKHDVTQCPSNPILVETKKQLDEYFNNVRENFDLPIKLEGTRFQQKVWCELSKIPYGTTCSYGDIARAIENEKAVRAVGQANRRNPIPIIVPCHRVIGKNRSLTGYSGTRTDLKEKLLQLEGVVLF